ncbi:MAG: hypothetical protein M3N31_09285 [Actinomycetota bacterium]|nr:hypothetical protein [Actinomycetota bacterium]
MQGRYPFLQREVHFPVPSPGDENGVLDLMWNRGGTEDEMAIAEVKPANAAGLLSGDRDLLWYEMQLEAVGHKVTRLNLPPPYGPIPFPTLAPPNCPQAQEMYLDPPVLGVYGYWCQPDYAELSRICDCRRGRRVPVPVPVRRPVPVAPRPVLEQIRDFVRDVVTSSRDAEQAARQWLITHPEVVEYLTTIAYVAAITIIVATIVEDIVTLGAGLADDPASFAAAAALVRVAHQMTAAAR